MAINYLPNSSVPLNNETQFPVGQELILVFDNPIDLKTFKESCILFGPDFDITSGPDNAVWLNQSENANPFFLKSPGFNGFVDYDLKQYLVNNSLEELADQTIIDKPNAQKAVVVITPKNVLKEDTDYSLFIIGTNVDNIGFVSNQLSSYSKNKAISFKTVYDATKDSVVDSRLKTYGSYQPKNNETEATINLKIIEAGEGSNAKYKWWFSDEAEPQIANSIYKERVSRCVQRWRTLSRGLLVRFSDATYALNETFQIKSYVKEFLQTSYLISFKTSNNEIYTKPTNPSTSPLLEESQLGNIDSTDSQLRIVSMTPSDGSVNNILDLKRIVITFNKNIDSSTVNQDAILLESLPASGFFDGNSDTRNNRQKKIFKIISINENKITLEI